MNSVSHAGAAELAGELVHRLDRAVRGANFMIGLTRSS